MHSIEDIRAEYARLDKLCGINSSGIEIKISHRAFTTFGLCKFVKKRRKYVPTKIQITDFVLNYEDEFWEIIRHEYAHLLVMMRDGVNHGHDAVWKRACLEVGCTPSRLIDSEALDQCAAERRRGSAREPSLFRFEVTCPACGHKWQYKTECKIVRAAKKHNCYCPCGCKDLTLKEI